MAWKSWRKWAAIGAEIGSVFLPGRFATAADKGAEKLKEAEEARQQRERELAAAGREKAAVIDPPKDVL